MGITISNNVISGYYDAYKDMTYSADGDAYMFFFKGVLFSLAMACLMK